MAVYVNSNLVSTVTLTADAWDAGTLALGSEGGFIIEAVGTLADEDLASDSVEFDSWLDDDEDGINECDGDCDDTDPDVHPCAEEV